MNWRHSGRYIEGDGGFTLKGHCFSCEHSQLYAGGLPCSLAYRTIGSTQHRAAGIPPHPPDTRIFMFCMKRSESRRVHFILSAQEKTGAGFRSRHLLGDGRWRGRTFVRSRSYASSKKGRRLGNASPGPAEILQDCLLKLSLTWPEIAALFPVHRSHVDDQLIICLWGVTCTIPRTISMYIFTCTFYS